MKQHKWHKDEALKMAIKALEHYCFIESDRNEALIACKKALEPQPKKTNIECNCYGDGNVYRGTRSSNSTIKTYTYPQDWLNQNPITQPKEPQYLYVYESVDGMNTVTTESIFVPSIKYHKYIGKIKLEDGE